MGKNSLTSSQREYSAFFIFEEYWVKGKSIEQISNEHGTYPQLDYHGIPTRNEVDAQALRHGKLEVYDLWEDYLTDFQLHLARELRTMRISDMRDATE